MALILWRVENFDKEILFTLKWFTHSNSSSNRYKKQCCEKVVMTLRKRWLTINMYFLQRTSFPAMVQVIYNLRSYITKFWTHSQFWTHSPMVPERMCGTTHSISRLWNTRSSVFERVVRTLVKLCVVNFKNLN